VERHKPVQHNTDTSFLRKEILVCLPDSFLRSKQLVADVCICQWPN